MLTPEQPKSQFLTPRPSGRQRALTVVAIGSLAVLFFTCAWQRVWGTDFWWQFATGRHIAEHGIPRLDPFSYSSETPRPWIELRWLYCLALYEGILHWGLTAVLAIKAAVLAGAFALVVHCIRPQRWSALMVAPIFFAILTARGRLFLRPEVISIVLFAVYLRLLVGYRDGGGRWIWAIPFLQLLWVNSHTVFIMGPVIVALAALSDAIALIRRNRMAADDFQRRLARLRELIVLTMFTGIACMANPYGWEGVLFPFQLFRQISGTAFKEFISEFGGVYNSPHSFMSVWAFDALLGMSVVSLLANLRRLDGFLTLLTMAMAYLSILAVRNLPFFAMVSVPFIAWNIHESALAQAPRVQSLLKRMTPPVCLVVIAASCWYSRQLATDRQFLGIISSVQCGAGYAFPEYPIEAERFLREANVPKPIFNTLAEGSFLLAQGHKVFIDPRLEVYGETFFSRQIDMLQNRDSLERGVAEFGVRTIFVGIHSRIINHVATSPNWKLVFFDECAAVFVRSDSLGSLRPVASTADYARVIAGIRERLKSPTPLARLGFFERATNSIPYMFLADFLRVMGQPGLALPFIEDALAAYPETINAARSRDDVLRILQRQAAAKP
ncbi:MAG: hypothetical protein HZA51_03710 [Planctomycetes bacterium]|nr:hypothetical protein [Planctomycetota bacterium]